MKRESDEDVITYLFLQVADVVNEEHLVTTQVRILCIRALVHTLQLIQP